MPGGSRPPLYAQDETACRRHAPTPARVALITGSAKRIGAAIARTLHAAGYDLALHYRHSRDELDALATELEAARPGSTLHPCRPISPISTACRN